MAESRTRSRKRSPSSPGFEADAAWLSLLLLAVLAGLAYGNTLEVPFILDDLESVRANPVWLTWIGETLPEKETALSGRPVVALTMALNYAAGGMQPRGYHLFNIAVHVLNAWLLYHLTVLTLRTAAAAQRLRGQAMGIGLATSCLWLVHPMQTEAVTYVSARTELMVATFYLATMLFAALGGHPGASWGWSIAAVACCALGMASKEVMVTAPVMVVAYDLALRGEPWAELLRRRTGFYTCLAATWLILATMMWWQPRRLSVGFGSDVTAWQYLAAQCEALLTYARLAVWPVGLCFDYGYVDVPNVPMLLAGGLFILAYFALIAWGWWRAPPIGFWSLWPALILAPTSSVVPIYTQVAADRRMYLPLAAVAVAVVLFLGWLIRRITSASSRPDVALPLTATVVLTLLILAGMAASRQRNALYADTERLWRHTVTVRPMNARAWHLLGDELIVRATVDGYREAVFCYRRAIELRPDYADVYNNLGVALSSLGQSDDAVGAYRRALTLKPGDVSTHCNLAHELVARGEQAEARQLFRKATELSPRYHLARRDYGLLLVDEGEYDLAIAELRVAKELAAGDFPTRRGLADALATSGRMDQAIVELDDYVQRFPEEPDAWWSLGVLRAAQGDHRLAIAHLQRCLELAPRHPQATRKLAELGGQFPNGGP